MGAAATGSGNKGQTMPAPSTAPRLHRDRVTWGAYFLLSLFTFFLNIQGNLIPFLRDTFGLSYTVAGLHPAAMAAGLIAGGLIGDRVTARVGRRGALALSVAGLAGGTVLFIVAANPILTIAGCFLFGFPGGLALLVVPALLAQIHGGNREIALSEANALCYAASLTAALTMGVFVYLRFDWRSSLVLGLAMALLFVLTFRSVRVPSAPAVTHGTNGGRLPPVYWLYVIVIFAVVAIEQGTLMWTPAFLEGIQGLSRSTAAWTTGFFSVGMMIGRTAGGPVLRRWPVPVVFVLSLALTLPGFLLYWLASIPVLCLIGLFVMALGTALLYPLALGTAIRVSGPLGDQASARAMLASGAAILIMPLALGALADRIGLWLTFLIMPALALLALLVFLWARHLERA